MPKYRRSPPGLGVVCHRVILDDPPRRSAPLAFGEKVAALTQPGGSMKPSGNSNAGRTAAADLAAATMLRSENFMKGWYSTDRLNSAFANSAASPRNFATVVPESSARQPPPVPPPPLPGSPMSPMLPSAVQDPLQEHQLILAVNTMMSRLEDRVEVRLGVHETILQRLEAQQQEILHLMRASPFPKYDSSDVQTSVLPNEADKMESRGPMLRPMTISLVQTGASAAVFPDTADKRQVSGAVASAKPTGRSPQAFLTSDAEEFVSGEGDVRHSFRIFESWVKGSRFDYFFGAIIVLNGTFLGVQIDIKARSLDQNTNFSEPAYFPTIETVFAAIFLVELVLRLMAWRLRYFVSWWNWFDMLVVACACLEEAIKYGIGGRTVVGKFSVFKLMRIVKLARTLRVIRVIRAFRELRIVVMAIIYCLRTLVSTLSLLFVLFYVMAIFILVELSGIDNAYDDSTKWGAARKELFPNMPRCLYTLYKSITWGLHWDTASSALEDVLPYMAVVWVLFIGVTVFAIANVVTGMFVQQAERVGLDDERDVLMEEKDLREVVVADVRTLLFKSDVDNTGLVTRKRLEDCLQSKQARRFLRKFDIDTRDVMAFFDLVCDHRNFALQLHDIDTFLNAIFRLRGVAKNIDLVALTFQHHAFLREHKHDSNRIQAMAKAFTKHR